MTEEKRRKVEEKGNELTTTFWKFFEGIINMFQKKKKEQKRKLPKLTIDMQEQKKSE